MKYEEDYRGRKPFDIGSDMPDGVDRTTSKEQKPFLLSFENTTSERLAEASGGKIDPRYKMNIYYPRGMVFFEKDQKELPFLILNSFRVRDKPKQIAFPLSESILIERADKTVDIVFLKDLGPEISYVTLSKNGITLHPEDIQHREKYLEIAFDLISIRRIEAL